MQDWQSQFQDHPANKLFKTALQPYTDAYHPLKKIGLLLPLTGKHRQASELIQKALFTAYFETRPSEQMITVYDTGQTQVYEQYRKATHEDKVQSIIGPLTKLEIDDLLSHQQIDTATLALNNASVERALLTQYSLAPLEETEQLVDNMILSGYRHPLILTDGTANATALANAFIEKFRAKGGVADAPVVVSDNINQGVADVMGTRDSQARHQFAQSLSSDPIRVVAEKRRDVDSIFAAGGMAHTRQLIPMLKYHYSGNLPIFATSTINKTSNPHKNQDLSGAIFFDTPLSPAVHQSAKRIDLPRKVMEKLKSSNPSRFFEQFRFYGLGFDAYLINQTSYLWDILDNYMIIGVNGILTRDQHGLIHRELSRMVFKHGAATVDGRYDNVREQWRQLTHDVIAR